MQADSEETSTQAEALARFCERAVPEALRRERADEFLAWAQSQGDSAGIADGALGPEDTRRLLYWLGRALWDRLPRPEHHFRPHPLPRPKRNQPCPCGSGRKFKQCCAALAERTPPVPDSLLGRVLPPALEAGQRQALAADFRAPVELKLLVARHAAEEGAPEQVAQLLEPVFQSQPVRGPLDLLLPGLDLLVEALEGVRGEPACRRLMEKLGEGDDGPLAGYALTWLAAEALVAGEGEESLRRVRRALEADPADPRPAILEVSALVELGRLEEARSRAAHWRREAQRHWPEEIEFIRRMTAYEAHPEQAHPDWMPGAPDEPVRG